MLLQLLLVICILANPVVSISYEAIAIDPPITSVPTNIPLEVTSIIINYNRDLETILDNAFSPYTNLTIANLNHNFISSIGTDAFSGVNLQELYLHDNELTAVPNLYIGSLLVLDVGHNKFSSVDDTPIGGYPILEELIVSKNFLAWDPATLGGINVAAATLKVLDLSLTDGPAIGELSGLSFLNLPNLDELYISKVDHLQGLPVMPMNSDDLNILGLEENDLTDIEISIYFSMTPFVELALLLNFNLLTDIPDMDNARRNAIQRLHISSNNITAITVDRLEGMTSLEHLSLGDNAIDTFPNFPSLPSLQFLYLYDNDITHLPEDPFYNLTSLIFLDVDSNQITEVADLTSVVMFLTSPLELYIVNNPLNCSCAFQFLLEAIQEVHPMTVTADTYPCSTPAELTAISAGNLTTADICQDTTVASNVTCQPLPTWYNIASDVEEVLPGQSITYYCREGYVFSDDVTDQTLTNVCDETTGAWQDSFEWCEEETSEEDADDSVTEAADGVLIGSLVILFVVGEIAFMVLIDLPALMKSCRRGKMNCKKRKGNITKDPVTILRAGHTKP